MILKIIDDFLCHNYLKYYFQVLDDQYFQEARPFDSALVWMLEKWHL